MNASEPRRCEEAARENESPLSLVAASRVALWIDADETDALLNLLLHAPETGLVSTEILDQLLHRVAEAHRALARESD